MKIEEIFNNINEQIFMKDSSSNIEKSFLGKKRTGPKEPTNTSEMNLDELLKENFNNNYGININPFNNINKLIPKQSLLIQDHENKENKLIEKKTDLTTLNLPKSNVGKIPNINDENQNNIYINFNVNIFPQKPNEIEILSSEAKEKEKTNINPPSQMNEQIIKPKGKKDLCCLALDLLNQNGEFQIKFSKNSDSAYILKIKEEEIKDNYYKQLDYAKYHGKYSDLKKTAPNNLFWQQRYYYFSKFDQGIKMDKDSWWSVTPEEIAKYTAKLIQGKTIIDGFCGCGGNVIQFSKYCSQVYAIDISESTLNMCKNNCKVYHCENNIKFIHSDFLEMKNKIKADYIFLSPPWGGTEYKKSDIYSIKKFMHPDITEIIRVSLNVADNILFFLPRNLDLDELFDICSSVKNEIKEGSGKNLFFDIRIIKSNGRIKSLLIIFGHHIKDYFSKHKLEKFVKEKYEKIDEKNLNDLYSAIKTIGCYRFFREEYIYRTTKTKESKGAELSYLNEFIKSISNTNENK